MVTIVIHNGCYYHYYDTYNSLNEAINVWRRHKTENKKVKYRIIKTVKGVWSSQAVYRLYLTNVATLRMG